MNGASRGPISRREFWKRTVFGPIALALAAGSAGAAGCAVAPRFRGSLSRGRIAVPRANLSPANAPDRALVVQAAEYAEPIILVWDVRDDGTPSDFLAFSALCTHQRCALKPGRNGFTCPCHGSVFDRAGRVVRGPAEEPLAQLFVEETTDGIEIIVAAG
ncbi:MAG: ubiquinol-cytochrome c reductase iron-sulfur subunit [bacterium]